MEQQEIKNEPKPKKLLNLSLRKKKDKFSGRHAEKAERFKAAKNIKIAASPNASVEKVEEMWEILDLPTSFLLPTSTIQSNSCAKRGYKLCIYWQARQILACGIHKKFFSFLF